MSCLSPLPVVICSTDNPRKSDVRFIKMEPDRTPVSKPTNFLPCGRCINCRLRYRHEWGIRCFHESGFSVHNHFVTLTYDPAYLPLNGSLCQNDLTLFLKRLRKRFAGNKASGIRYFACGEYGTANKRPHYHVVFFNLPLTDLFFDREIKGVRYHRSATLESVWGKGHVLVGPVNYESAAYVAGYALKKQTGTFRHFYYKNLSTGVISSFKCTSTSAINIPVAEFDEKNKHRPSVFNFRRGKVACDLSSAVDISTGELIFPELLDSMRNPFYDRSNSNVCILDDEFSVMSRNPGIGDAFYQKYKKEMFRNGFIVFKGKKRSIPKAYVAKYNETCSDEEYKAAKAARIRFIDSLCFSSTDEFDPVALQKKLESVETRFKLFSDNRHL